MSASASLTEFLFLWLLFILMLFNSVQSSSKIHCNEKDKNTLLHFKGVVTDPSNLLSSWSSEQNCCEWKGVHCDNFTGRVTHLNLPCPYVYPDIFIFGEKDEKSPCLTGEFDTSLLQLEFLSYLNLSDNDFMVIKSNSMVNCNDLSSDTLPYHCGNSSNLRYLDLSGNYFVIDSLNWISRLSSLEYLNLNYIEFHKETNWLQSMTMLPSLSELHLQSCELENIYPSLQYANFTSLEVLDLVENNFMDQLPSWLFNLSSKISYVDLSENQIHGQLPKTFPNHLRNIKSLILAENKLNGSIPDWLGQLERLQMLDLSYNSFSGPIPTNIGNLSTLTTLNLKFNFLNGSLPESFVQLFNLETLCVFHNSFTNVSERNFVSLSKLKYLCFSSQEFHFDPEWVPPFQLERLCFSYMLNKLPSWLFTQNSLKELYIEHSSASFEPLDKFWNFTAQIPYLFLHNNSINGDMSDVLLNSKVAWLRSNNLKGGLPRLSPNVTLLNLYDNSISGSISTLLCQKMFNKSNLRYLFIANNLLSGELTDCWKDWKSLAFVVLGNNNLSGKIPHSIGFLSNLFLLDLTGNKFYGDIPLSLKKCKDLRILTLAGNSFSGPIPSWVGHRVTAFQLRSNQFSGIIPPKICQLNQLVVFDIAFNKLSGPIPNCLDNMSMKAQISAIIIYVEGIEEYTYVAFTMLVKSTAQSYKALMNVVDLSSNNFSGTLPPELFMLTGLQSLNLSHNRLVGTIPEEIGNLKQLESIDLSSNQFTGVIPQSMTTLTFIGFLNLSFNNFMGKIPTGTQLQSFTDLSYMGNPQLCGPPLVKILFRLTVLFFLLPNESASPKKILCASSVSPRQCPDLPKCLIPFLQMKLWSK